MTVSEIIKEKIANVTAIAVDQIFDELRSDLKGLDYVNSCNYILNTILSITHSCVYTLNKAFTEDKKECEEDVKEMLELISNQLLTLDYYPQLLRKH